MAETAVRAEMLGGERFAWSDRTPRLRGMVDALATTLGDALRPIDPHARLLREPDLLLSAQAATIPDLAIFTGPTWDVPALVIEYRAESTDRLFFGPKRLAYGRALVREVWFADADTRCVTALRLGDRLDYPWPAESYRIGESVPARTIPGLALAVAAFFVEPPS